MKFNVYWKDIKFLEVEKINNMYYSKVIGENIDKVENEGFPITFLSSIKSMDGELPKIIQSRLPKIEYISEKIEQSERLIKLNKIAISQMEILTGINRKLLR